MRLHDNDGVCANHTPGARAGTASSCRECGRETASYYKRCAYCAWEKNMCSDCNGKIYDTILVLFQTNVLPRRAGHIVYTLDYRYRLGPKFSQTENLFKVYIPVGTEDEAARKISSHKLVERVPLMAPV